MSKKYRTWKSPNFNSINSSKVQTALICCDEHLNECSNEAEGLYAVHIRKFSGVTFEIETAYKILESAKMNPEFMKQVEIVKERGTGGFVGQVNDFSVIFGMKDVIIESMTRAMNR